MSTTSAPPSVSVSAAPGTDPRPAMIALSLWGFAALGLALAGAITLERRFLIPLGIVGSVLALVVLHARWPSLRALADGVELRVPILYHVIRAPIGVGFLLMMTEGLDADFARIGGYGDIVCGLLAFVAAGFVGRARERLVVRAWNVLGLVDILLVILTAQRIIFLSDHPETMAPFTRFPFAMLPLFIVPLVIATHLLVFRRTSRAFVPRV